ncbi:hypothetical protein J5J83_15085 [Azoarcus sp. L1K30]|uniref:DUF7933 domain-containing protein n=1 Tax=Azoarcus sp. L1K30 TaxID=2820277 RepID=UPI001B81DD69|nr:choice-of-anchor U domain-containing protein [Azoarcus sp. L1K30]MBR0567445.1 hypothetical protein [Azoarcus sp. L1K30]
MSARFDLRIGGSLVRWLACFVTVTATAFAQPALAAFTQVFAPSTVAPGTATLLTFTIQNGGVAPLTSVAFANTLPAGVTFASPAIVRNTCGGEVSAPDGGSTITLASGLVPAGGSCTVSAYVVAAAPGSFSNTSGDLTSSEGNGGSSTATLTVDSARPAFHAAYSAATVHWRDRVVLTYTVDNPGSGSPATVLFTDELPQGLVLADPVNSTVSTCIGGTVSALPGTRSISLTSAFSLASSSCTIAVDVFAEAVGSFAHASSPLTVSPGGGGGIALAALEVLADTVGLSQRIERNPAIPGESVSVSFRIVNTSRTDSASGLSFTDDLDAALSGLSATGLPLSNVCGSGSSLSGSGVLTLTGGSLAPGASCEFSVPLQVPAGAARGSYPNTTSALSGTLGAGPIVSNAATDVLQVDAVPRLVKKFLAPVVGSGQSITLRYTLANTSATDSLSFTFVDNYGDYVSTVPTFPGGTSVCGGTLSGTVANTIDPARVSGSLSLAPGGTCSFDVDLPITAGVRSGRFSSVSETATGTVAAVTLDARVTEDSFVVVPPPALTLDIAESFAAAGGTATLDVLLSNDSGGQVDADEYDSFSAIAFTLDLDAALSGLSASGLPLSNVCGSGSQLTGATVLALTGGVLGSGQNCSFSVPLSVPALAASGTYALTSSPPSGVARGVVTMGTAAATMLTVGGLGATQAFIDDPVAPGGTTTLRFTLTNDSLTEAATSINVSQVLGRVISGLVATGLPAADVCGAGSSLSGTGTLALSGGSLAPGGSCTFDVTLAVPAGAAAANYPSSTDLVRATYAGAVKNFAQASAILKVEVAGAPRDLTPLNLDESDPDGDGIPTSVEQALGDVNGDGIPDALQATVASLVSPVTGRAVALSVEGGCDKIVSFSVVSADSLGIKDGDARYPEGVASFDLECTTAQVTLWFPGADFSGPMAVRKFGPVAPDFGGASRWYAVSGGVIDRTAKTIRFSVIDGGVGDSTGADGHIIDPVGPAILPLTQIPALSPAAFALLAMMLAGVGSVALRRAGWQRRR